MCERAVGSNVEAENAAYPAYLRVTNGVEYAEIQTAGNGTQVHVAGRPRLNALRPTQRKRHRNAGSERMGRVLRQGGPGLCATVRVRQMKRHSSLRNAGELELADAARRGDNRSGSGSSNGELSRSKADYLDRLGYKGSKIGELQLIHAQRQILLTGHRKCAVEVDGLIVMCSGEAADFDGATAPRYLRGRGKLPGALDGRDRHLAQIDDRQPRLVSDVGAHDGGTRLAI